MLPIAIMYNLSTAAMRADGLADTDISQIYQTEIPRALALCGFTEHLQRTLYATDASQTLADALRRLREVLPTHAPNLCKYATRVHVFRLDDWSDVTDEFTGFATFGDPRFADETPDPPRS